MIFCDTSTLAKYYVPEKESSSVRSCLDKEDQVVVSDLARVELMGVFHRYLRERQWTREEFTEVVRQFSQDNLSGYWSWMPLDKEILEKASQVFVILPETIFLRSSDCIHLVTAIHHGFKKIYTYDKHQAQAASVLGLAASK